MKLGIIGCGIIMQEAHLPPLLKLNDRIEIIALCNRSRPKAEKAAELIGNSALPLYTDWQEMIRKEKKLDSVLISLPIPLNYPVSKACIDAGLNVICEKPAGMTGDEAEKTLQLNKPDGPLFMTAENYQYHPGYLKVGTLIEEGLIGRLHSLQWNSLKFASVDNKYNKTEWRSHNRYPGGYVLDGGVHFVHTLQQLAGPVVSAYAKVGSINPQLGTVDMGFALLTHASGVVSSLNMGWQHKLDEKTLIVFGTKGSLTLKESHILHLTEEGDAREYAVDEDDSFYQEWLDFYQSARDGKTPQLLQADAVRDVKVIEAVLQSGKEGKVISL